MNDHASPQPALTGSDIGGYGAPTVLMEGPFSGWSTWGVQGPGCDPFEAHNGPFCFKKDSDGRIRAAFQPEAHHINGGGALHGGALMSFADFSLFAIAADDLKGVAAVTLSFNAEFVGAGGLSGWVEADGRVIKSTRSIVFVQAVLVQMGKPLLAFSGTLKKLGQ